MVCSRTSATDYGRHRLAARIITGANGRDPSGGMAAGTLPP